MDLLPKSKSEFSSKEYWEGFFEKREHAFEWYGEYVDLCQLLDKYCKFTDKILMSGCGNSNLSEDMFDIGYQKIVNIDISDVVLKRMNSKSKGRMQYLKMDIKETTFADNEFSVVLDKGTLDAIYSHDDAEIGVGVEKMFTEILRILKVGGRYICITLAQDHILNKLLSFFPKSCFVRVHEIQCVREKETGGNGGLGSKLPVFMFVCTKMKCELANPVLEMVFFGKEKVEKFKVPDDIKKNIEALQTFSLVKHKMESTLLREEVKVDLWSHDESLKEPRYSLFVIDTKRNKSSNHNGVFAVFIVPKGRENNETFGSSTGRQNLAEAAGFLRLVVATLHRGHVYKDLDEVKSDLSEKVMDFAPANWDKSMQVPFLSTSSDIGNRNVAYESASAIYGNFVIEDVQSEEQFYFRQFVSLNNRDKIISKTRLMLESNKKKKSKKRIPDPKYLMQTYEKSMLSGFSFLSSLNFTENVEINVLIFGLCNTPFVSCLLNLFPTLHVTCVDVDSTLLDVYKNWFGLNNLDRVTFIEKDIVSFSNECGQTDEPMYDVVVIDHIPRNCDENGQCDKDLSNERSCDFSEEVFVNLRRVLKACGVFMRIQRKSNDTCAACKEDMKLLHFETNASSTAIQYFINYDVNNNSVDHIWEQAKAKSKQLVELIMAKKPGFYDKHEWTLLIQVVENLSSFH